MAMPLVVQGEIAGCLFAWMQESSRRFTDLELDFARRLAASVALALENSRLLAMEHEARARAEAAEASLGQELEYTRVLIRASDELTTTTDSDELLNRLASVVLESDRHQPSVRQPHQPSNTRADTQGRDGRTGGAKQEADPVRRPERDRPAGH